MADKDAEGLLAALEPALAHVVVTQNLTSRAMPVEQLAATATEVFGEDRVTVAPGWPRRSTRHHAGRGRRRLRRPARRRRRPGHRLGGHRRGGAHHADPRERREHPTPDESDHPGPRARRAAACARRSSPSRRSRSGLTTPVMISVSDVDTGAALGGRPGAGRRVPAAGRDAAPPVGLRRGLGRPGRGRRRSASWSR